MNDWVSKKYIGEERKLRLKNRISDLYNETSNFWRTSEEKKEINKEINKISKELKTKYKLKNWEY